MAIDGLTPLFAPGQRLGRYELTQRLAVGGMAEVYLAFASGAGDFHKVVAIKRLLPQHALDPQLLRMFLDEARLMARLSHPNVAQVTDVGEGSAVEVPYFVMEYIQGTDLRGVLNAAGGPLPIEHALAIASAVAAGLHHAHEQRGENGQPLEIVHRDVSPSNVLISFNGGVRVTDFGVAKWAEQRSFTHNGQLKGKFAHMSPEQCRGEVLDRRSDVFALGTLLYEMVTGHSPFVADSDYELLTQIVSRDAPLPERPGEEVPAPLAFIIMRSLRRARDDRYPTAQALQLDLEAFAREHKLVVSPVALAGYLESLFGARVTEWRQAFESGQTLADDLARQPATAGTPAGTAAMAAATATATATAGARRQAGATASRSARTSERTATDTYSPSLWADPGSSTTPRTPEARARGIWRRRALTGAFVVAVVMVATVTTMKMRRPPPVNQIPVPSAAAPLVSPAVASWATPAATRPSPRPARGSGAEAPPPSHPARTSRRARLSDLGDPSDAPGETPSVLPSNNANANAPSETAQVPGGTPTARPESPESPRAPTPPDSPSSGPKPGATTPTTPATTPVAPPARGAPTPLKVWDPDSPVPP